MIALNTSIIRIVFAAFLVIATVAVAYLYIRQIRSDKVEQYESKSAKEIILYYHPNCGHCQEFKPTWINFQQRNSNARMVDCSKSSDPKCRLVPGYPTVLGIVGDEVSAYDGPRTIEGLESFKKNI